MSEAMVDEVSAGTLLRRAREAAGVHVATLAVALKVPVRKIEALEEDRYDLIGDAVFARALASSMCRTLKMDPRPVLERLPQGPTPSLAPVHQGLNTPFRAPGDAAPPSWVQHVLRPVPLAVIALLLGALVILLLPVLRGENTQPPQAHEPVMPPGTPAVVSVPPADAPAVPVTAASGAENPPIAGSAPANEPSTAAVATAAAPTAQPASAAAAAPAAQPASAPAAAAAQAAGIVTFRTRGSSWIQVTDARGNAVLRKLMAAGETASATGALPLTVTVGSVRDTEVQVRGQAYDLTPTSRDNVARFEVK